MYDPATCTSYTYHTYYVLMSDPVSPCSEPWVEILDYACEWAYGTNNGNSVCDNILTNSFHQYYQYRDGNCAYLSSDFVRLAATLGVNSTIVRWTSKWEGPQPGDMFEQISDTITTVGNQYEQVFYWHFHQWVTNGGYIQRDPSAGISFSGSWGQYEDAVIDSYWRRHPQTGISELVDNQEGQPYYSCEDYRKPIPDNCSILIGYTVLP